VCVSYHKSTAYNCHSKAIQNSLDMASMTITNINGLNAELLLLLLLQPFYDPLTLSNTTQVRQYQKGKTILDLVEQETVSDSGISWTICKFASCPRQITMPASHYSVFTGLKTFTVTIDCFYNCFCTCRCTLPIIAILQLPACALPILSLLSEPHQNLFPNPQSQNRAI